MLLLVLLWFHVNFNIFNFESKLLILLIKINKASPSTGSKCNVLVCSYGQLFDPGTCLCKCDAANGFSGTLCEIIDCSIASDASECNSLGCTTGFEYTCPYRCGLCPITSSKTSTSTTTTTTTTTTTIGKLLDLK